MRDAFRNLLGGSPQNLVDEVYIMAILIWMMVLIATLWSIIGSIKLGKAQKVFWSVIVICLPLVGVGIYAVYSVFNLEFFLLHSKDSSNKGTMTVDDAQAAEVVL